MDRRSIAKPADRDEWLALRRPFFNASATSILFDRHPFMSPGDYATIKLTGVEQAETRAMRRGTMLERAVADWWASERKQEDGVRVSGLAPADELFVAGCVMATPDFFWWGEPVEIKTTADAHFEPAPYWKDQCQSILLCTGAPVMHLVWLDPRMDIQSVEVEADEELQAEILSRAERFMAAIELGIVPDWIELSYQNVAQLYPQSEGVVAFDDDDLLLVQQLDMTRRIKRDAEKDEGVIKDMIAKRLLVAEVGTYDGHEILTWRTSKPRHELDVDMLRADYPDLVEKYTIEKPGRRTMLVKLGDVPT